jgi:SWI/SNF-related matrix-associated actin-dependent regulator 1 of chromatin subfamily A
MKLPSNLKSPDGKTPLPYQVEGAIFALSSYYSLNKDEMGLGKTLQAILSACMLIEENPKAKVIVICPTYLKRNWKNEVEEWSHLRIGWFNHEEGDVFFDQDIVLVSYYQLRVFWERISENRFDFVVVDEAHNFKNPKAKQTLALLNLVREQKSNHLLLLTGTPIKNRVPDLFIPLFLFSMSKKTDNPITKKYRSYFLFCYNFCIVRKTNFGTQFTGMKNVDELKTYLRGRMIGRKKKDVIGLPPVIEKQVVVDYKESPELLREYETFNGMVESAESSAKAESARLKAKFTSEYVRDLLEQEAGPVVVFTDHRSPIPIIQEGLVGYRVAVVHGGVTNEAREQIKEGFQSGAYDVLIATFGSFSTGVTLTRASNLVINDLTWIPSVLAQAIDRIHRIGQTRDCIIHFIMGAVVDKKILRSLKDKLRTIKKILE